MVDQLPKVVKGKVSDLLTNVDERGKLDYVCDELDLHNVLDREMKNLSWGEIQLIDIDATLYRDGEYYL